VTGGSLSVVIVTGTLSSFTSLARSLTHCDGKKSFIHQAYVM